MTFRAAAIATRPALALLVAGLFSGLVATSAPAQEAQRPAERGAELASHEAHYDMNLASVRSAAGVVGAAGTMDYAFTQGCDGWTVETRTDLSMVQTQGGSVNSSWEFVSWEARDGQSYRFRVRNTRNGVVLETYEGEATLKAEGGGTAVFHLPSGEDKTFDLPEGTMFPTSHTLTLIDQARAGKRFFAAPVFDGSAVQGAFSVSAAIGAPVADPQASHLKDEPLLATQSWPMTLAFFSNEPRADSADSGDLPDFEVSLRYHANGIAQDILQDFGDFSLRGVLAEIEDTDRTGC